jgi:hypothetical protein
MWTTVLGYFFTWMQSRQETKAAEIQDKNTKDTNDNIRAQILDDQARNGISSTFWLVALEALLTIIVMWNIIAYGFHLPMFQTQFDPIALLLSLLGIHVLKIGHKYVTK